MSYLQSIASNEHESATYGRPLTRIILAILARQGEIEPKAGHTVSTVQKTEREAEQVREHTQKKTQTNDKERTGTGA